MPPTINTTKESPLTVVEGTELELDCVATGFPAPRVSTSIYDSFSRTFWGMVMDQITMKTPNPNCRLKTLNWCLILKIQSVMLVLSTPLENLLRPSNLLTGSPSPLPPLLV